MLLLRRSVKATCWQLSPAPRRTFAPIVLAALCWLPKTQPPDSKILPSQCTPHSPVIIAQALLALGLPANLLRWPSRLVPAGHLCRPSTQNTHGGSLDVKGTKNQQRKTKRAGCSYKDGFKKLLSKLQVKNSLLVEGTRLLQVAPSCGGGAKQWSHGGPISVAILGDMMSEARLDSSQNCTQVR